MRNIRAWSGLVLGLCLSALATMPGEVQARGLGDKLFNGVKDTITSSVDPDTIEMARFSIAHPNEAATVYSRAAAQDYPFFAMIGAVKSVKNRDLPKIGKFTYEKCVSPIAAIDSVFAGASSRIDDAQGKANTNAAMEAASSIAADYAKAQSDAARQELIDTLSQVVPYFGDLPTICLFAFDTDLQAERNIQMIVNQVSQDIRTAYFAFKSGDVVTGAEALISLGAGKEVVCKLIDSAVGGGIIGRTPGLGTLAQGLCSGFVGAVIDGLKGVVNGGIGAVEAGANFVAGAACEVASWFGGGCSSAEPPPSGLGNAGQWCAARGGIGSFLSKTNQPDDYYLVCVDGSKCAAKPGHPLVCATAAEQAAHEAQLVSRAQAEFESGLPRWQADYDQRWLGQCPDEACKAGLRLVRLNATNLAKSRHESQPGTGFQMLTYFIFEAADRQAVSVLDDRNYRLQPPLWQKNFLARSNSDCEDELCRAGMKFVAANALLQVQQKAGATPRPPYATTTSVYLAAEQQRATLLAESTKRAAEFNKTNTANAGIAWELLTNAIWGKQCSDAACLSEVKKLSAQMRIAGNLVQMAKPDESSLAVQKTVNQEYGPKFKAAVDSSKARATAQVPAVPPIRARPPGQLQPLMQKVNFTRPSAPYNGRPVQAQPAARGFVPLRVGPTVSLQPGTDRMGGDYKGFALDRAEPQLCRQACADDAGCKSYTYVNPGIKGPQAMCFLKNVVPPSNADACCTSGQKQEVPRR